MAGNDKNERAALRARLTAFDGRATTILGEAEARFRGRPGYLANLVSLAGDPEPAVSSGATWLIKAHLDAGGALPASEADALLSRLDTIVAWQAQLHLCQIARDLRFGAEQARCFADWLEPLLGHERSFLRAWSLDALCRLALRDEAYRPPAKRALQRAALDRAASVAARVRRLQKETGL